MKRVVDGFKFAGVVLFAPIVCFSPMAQAQSCTATPPGIGAWWPGNGNANDIIAGHRGTIQGGVTFVPGVVGEAFNFDGSTGYIEIPSSPALMPPSVISLSAWVYPTSFPPYPYGLITIISKYDSYDQGAGVSWFLGVQSTGQIEWYVQDEQNTDMEVVTVGSLSLNTWQHVAATFDTATQATAVYIGGVQVPFTNESSGTVTSIQQSSATVLIGAYISSFTGGLGAYWPGMIDEVQLYQKVLTAPQVARIYRAGSAGSCPPAWRLSRRYFRGDEVHDLANHVQMVVIPGTSSATAPTWNDTGGRTIDGTVVWKDEGLEP